MRKQPLWKIGGVLIFVVGLGGLPDDLLAWKEWLVMIFGRGWLSWIFIFAGLLMLA